MYISGYKKGVVINIVRGVLKRYKQMLESDSEGTTPLWRSRSQIMTMKKAKPGRTSSNWFMKGDNRQFMCLPVTPGGHLVSRMRKELGTFKGPDKGTTKYSERAGRSILAGISKDDPFPKVGCTFGDPECLVGPGCDKGGVCYEILCKECIPDDPQDGDINAGPIVDLENVARPLQDPRMIAGPAENLAGARRPQRAKYLGHTGTSMHRRMLGHKEKKSTGINKHTRDRHPDNPPRYLMRPVRGSRTNLERTTAEGILMEEEEKDTPGILMNSKSEGGRGKLVRYVPQVTRI